MPWKIACPIASNCPVQNKKKVLNSFSLPTSNHPHSLEWCQYKTHIGSKGRKKGKLAILWQKKMIIYYENYLKCFHHQKIQKKLGTIFFSGGRNQMLPLLLVILIKQSIPHCMLGFVGHVETNVSSSVFVIHSYASSSPGNHHSTLCVFELFQVVHISGVVKHLSFCAWCISPSVMSSRFIYDVAYGRISFFFLTLNNILFYIFSNSSICR